MLLQQIWAVNDFNCHFNGRVGKRKNSHESLAQPVPPLFALQMSLQAPSKTSSRILKGFGEPFGGHL